MERGKQYFYFNDDEYVQNTVKIPCWGWFSVNMSICVANRRMRVMFLLNILVM